VVKDDFAHYLIVIAAMTTLPYANSQNHPYYDHTLKVLFIGDSIVGKTALVHRYVNGTFTSETVSTIGVDFAAKILHYKQKRFRLTLWDTAGQERFRTLTRAYYRGAHGVVLCFDVTNAESYFHVKSWLSEVRQYNEGVDVPCVLVGTKCDLIADRVIDFAAASKLAKELGVPYVDTSAKRNVGIVEVFDQYLLPLMADKRLLEVPDHAAPKPVCPAKKQISLFERCWCNIV